MIPLHMKISILGCGWLGLPLAKALLEQGFIVNGSTTSAAKIPVLKNVGIHAFQISLNANGIAGDVMSFLDNSEILIVDIPPKLRGSAPENFVGKIENLIPYIESSTIRNVLFVSSISVYADDNSIITEASLPKPESESGRQLLEAEQLMQNSDRFKSTVVRFGGLIGGDRHPIKILSGRTHIENPEAPINLIHQIDCIGIILEIIKKNAWAEIFNAVAPCHPTRKTYYTQKAEAMQLALPEFEENKLSFGKTITSKNLTTVLNYQFQKPNL